MRKRGENKERRVMERKCGCEEARRGQGQSYTGRVMAHLGFAVVGFCEVTEVKPLPVVAAGERLNELHS